MNSTETTTVEEYYYKDGEWVRDRKTVTTRVVTSKEDSPRHWVARYGESGNK